MAPNRSKFGRKISVVKSICGAISQFVPPLRFNTTDLSQNNAAGNAIWSNKGTLLQTENRFSKCICEVFPAYSRTQQLHQQRIRTHVNDGQDEIRLRLSRGWDQWRSHHIFLWPIGFLLMKNASNRVFSRFFFKFSCTFHVLESQASFRSSTSNFDDFYWFFG